MPPTFWVEIEIEGGMGCYRGMTGGEVKRLWMQDNTIFEAKVKRREGKGKYGDFLYVEMCANG